MAVDLDVRHCHECPLNQYTAPGHAECRHPGAAAALRGIPAPEHGKRDPCPLWDHDVVVIGRPTAEDEAEDALEATSGEVEGDMRIAVAMMATLLEKNGDAAAQEVLERPAVAASVRRAREHMDRALGGASRTREEQR